MAYQPIEHYGVIGDMRTAALVSQQGSIDWFCFPRFDSPSVFAALLDDRKGGSYRIAPTDPDARFKQFYWPDTNVLVTRFFAKDGVGEIQDFMPIGGARVSAGGAPRDLIIRRVKVVRGSVRLDIACEPAFDYARAAPKTHITHH